LQQAAMTVKTSVSLPTTRKPVRAPWWRPGTFPAPPRGRSQPIPTGGPNIAGIRIYIRAVTNKSFFFHFEIDETWSEVRILATFFGGADHSRQIVERFWCRTDMLAAPLRLHSNFDWLVRRATKHRTPSRPANHDPAGNRSTLPTNTQQMCE
jgi:hypothetical protein